MNEQLARERVTVFQPKVARKLLQAGFQIVDIKPDKADPCCKKTLFVFRNEQGFGEALRRICNGECQESLRCQK